MVASDQMHGFASQKNLKVASAIRVAAAEGRAHGPQPMLFSDRNAHKIARPEPGSIRFATMPEAIINMDSEHCLTSALRPDVRGLRVRRAICAFSGLVLVVLIARNSGTNSYNELLWDPSSSETGQAAAVRGSISTADAEATAIMQTNGIHFDEDMGTPYTRGIENRGEFDPTMV
jgi:hypothetical protein